MIVNTAGETVVLHRDDVHVWRVACDVESGVIERLLGALSIGERERAGRLRFAPDRRRFIARHAALRILLAAYAGCDPSAVTFGFGTHGKPRSRDRSAADIQFNISSSGQVALLAFTRNREVGVDIERIRDDVDWIALAVRFFAAAEADAIGALEGPARRDAFFTYWVCKEAWLKATGVGLSSPLDRWRIEWRPGTVPTIDAPGAVDQRWTLRLLDEAPRYAAAAVVNGSDVRWRHYELRLVDIEQGRRITGEERFESTPTAPEARRATAARTSRRPPD